MRGKTDSRYEQFETSPEMIEQELRRAVCEQQNCNAFSTLHFCVLKVMFRYHFLDHFSTELKEICCESLLNSILMRKTVSKVAPTTPQSK